MRSSCGATGRPGEVYPIVYIDGIRLQIRDKGAVTIKVAHLARRDRRRGPQARPGLLGRRGRGIWKFWLSVLTQLRNRGLREVLLCCCDGLSGLPESITTAFCEHGRADLCGPRPFATR